MTTSLQYTAAANPYDPNTRADHYALWQILIARDSEAFASANWSHCEKDFSRERFEGIHAHGSLDPTAWTLCYPTLDAYRDDWIEMARQYRTVPLADLRHAELLFKMQSFAQVEIDSARAIVCKQFWADEPLANGERYRVSAQSVYRLHHLDGRWQIVGFVGYLPLESKTHEVG
jgi:hypothetical protein